MAADNQLLNNGAACPARSLDRLSNKDDKWSCNGYTGTSSKYRYQAYCHQYNGSDISCKGERSTLRTKYTGRSIHEDDKGPGMVRMEVTVSNTDLRYSTIIRLETSIRASSTKITSFFKIWADFQVFLLFFNRIIHFESKMGFIMYKFEYRQLYNSDTLLSDTDLKTGSVTERKRNTQWHTQRNKYLWSMILLFCYNQQYGYNSR